MTVSYPDLCYNEVCSKGTALYLQTEHDQTVDKLTETCKEVESYKEKLKALESDVDASKGESKKYREKISELQSQVDSTKGIREKMKLLEAEMASFRKEKEEAGAAGRQETESDGPSREELQKVQYLGTIPPFIHYLLCIGPDTFLQNIFLV